MRVLFVHRSPLGAFGEAAMHHYPACLVRQGHEAVMVAPASGDSGILAEKGVRVREVAAGEPWLAAIRRIVEEEQPEIVHVYLHSGCGLLPLLLRRFSPKTRFVLDIRSPLLRTGLLRLLHRAKNFFEPLFFDAIASHGIESAWTQIGKREGIHWLPPGVDFSLIPPARARKVNARTERCRMVYIGSLDAIRKVDVMLSAVIDVLRKFEWAQLDIFGDGSLRKMLQEQANTSGCIERIRFMGVVSRQKLLALLPDYDVGLAYIPAGIYDAAPALKTLEYLASGLSVVATDTLGNRMFVEHGVNGMLVGSDREGFAKGIRDMLQHPDRENMSARARPSVEAFDWMRLTRERLLPLYESLIGKGGDA